RAAPFVAGGARRAGGRESGAARRLLRLPERQQAPPAVARGFRAAARAPAEREAAARRGGRRALRPRTTARAPGPRRLVDPPRGIRARGTPLVANGGLRRARQPALADDGRDVGRSDPRPRARQADARVGRRLVLGAARRGGAED